MAKNLFLSLACTDAQLVEFLLRQAEFINKGPVIIDVTEEGPNGEKITKKIPVRDLTTVQDGLVVESKRNDQNAGLLEFKAVLPIDEGADEISEEEAPEDSGEETASE